jgi:hypothetical protein
MMKLIATFLLLAAASATASTSPAIPRTGPYVYCNVYLSSVCFGIRSGDNLTMEIPADFVLYRIQLAFGAQATIYVGDNPELRQTDESKFQSCPHHNGFTECKQFKGAGIIEFIGRNDAKSPFVHVVLRFEKESPALTSFLNNVRACTRAGASITCSQ